MTIVLFPVLAIIIGLLMWILPLPPKAQEAGKILFTVGIFWLVAGNHGPDLTLK